MMAVHPRRKSHQAPRYHLPLTRHTPPCLPYSTTFNVRFELSIGRFGSSNIWSVREKANVALYFCLRKRDRSSGVRWLYVIAHLGKPIPIPDFATSEIHYHIVIILSYIYAGYSCIAPTRRHILSSSNKLCMGRVWIRVTLCDISIFNPHRRRSHLLQTQAPNIWVAKTFLSFKLQEKAQRLRAASHALVIDSSTMSLIQHTPTAYRRIERTPVGRGAFVRHPLFAGDAADDVVGQSVQSYSGRVR
jgi:hypothetical protein